MADQDKEGFTDRLAKARQGNGEAWGELLDRYRGYLNFLAWFHLDDRLRRKVGTGDLVQETFLRAHRYRESFQGQSEEELAQWLRKILASRIAEQFAHFETQRRNVRLEIELERALGDSSRSLKKCLASPDDTPSTRAQNREVHLRVADALNALPDDYRRAVVWRHLEGRTLAEICEISLWSVDQAQKFVQRGLRKLAEILGEQDR